jgi:hypothetical protein
MIPAKLSHLPRRQDGVVAIEFFTYVAVTALMMAMLLQVGRTMVLYNVTVSAAYSAAMHVATMPQAELINSLVAKPSTQALVEKMRVGGAIDISNNSFAPFFSCTPSASAPCTGTTIPTQVHVRVEHIQRDTIFPIFTGDVDNQIDSLFIRYRARIPRVGFVKL